MSSDVEICNMALGAVGVSREIDSLDEISTEAEQCKRFYEPVRDAVLRDHLWEFAKKYQALNVVEVDPNDDWGYSYRQPPDCLRARRLVLGRRDLTTRVPWTLGLDGSGRLIYTDQPNAVLLYTSRVTNSEFFDPSFVQAFVWRLASTVAIPLSRSEKERKYALDRYLFVELPLALANDGNERAQDAPADAESISARE